MSTRLAIIEDRYRLEGGLGSGTQGETFAAFDQAVGSRVALKLLFEAPRAQGHSVSSTERLLDEYRYLATLRHPHLVRVFDVGRVTTGPDAGRLFFTSELLATGDAAGLDPNATREPVALLGIARALADALSLLHQAGLLHRDVKPENLGRSADGSLRLFDLGLATPDPSGAQAGSLPYAAPELFLGEGDARADLYSLGITLLALRLGAAPLVDGRPLWMASATTRQTLITRALDGAPTAFVNLVGTLVEPEVQRRPHDAIEVLAALDRIAGRASSPARRMVHPPLVGREAALTDLVRALDLAQGSEVVLRAPPGAGAGRVVTELRLRLQLAALAHQRSLRVVTATALAANTASTTDLDPQALDRRRRQAVGAAWQAVRHPGTLLLLDDDAPAELLEVAQRGGLRPAACLWVTASDGSAFPSDTPTIALSPLDDADGHALVASMRAFDREGASLLIEHAAGLPGALVALVRRVDLTLGDALATGPAVEACLIAERSDGPSHPALDSDERALLLLVAIGPQRIPLARAATLLGCALPTLRARAAALSSRGLMWVQAGTLRLAPSTGAIASRLHAADPTVAPTLLAALDATDDTLRRAELLLLLGDDEAAAVVLAEPPADPLAVRSWQRLAALLLARRDAPDVRRQLIALLLLRSRYREALRWIDAASAPTDSLRLLGAEIALRLGDRESARARLVDVKGEAADALRARAHFQLGEWDAALACLGADVTSPFAQETRALAQMYRHDYIAASASLDRLLRNVVTDAARARARSLCGMLAHLRGELAAAEAHFAAALALAANDGDLHAEAIYTTNLAAARREQAHFSDALAPTARSLELLKGFGRPAELAIALYNAGNLELSLGSLDDAGRFAERARDLGVRLGDARAQALADNLSGDLALRQGDAARAEAAYVRALARATAPGDRLVIAANLVDIAALRGDADTLARASAQLAAEQPQSAAERLRCARAEVTVALAEPSRDAATTDALAARLEAALADVAVEGREHDVFRGRMAQLRLAIASGDPVLAQRRLLETKRSWEHIVSFIPPSRLQEASTDPDVEKLQKLLQASPPVEPARSSPGSASTMAVDDNATERLLEVVKRLNSETRLELLLEFILDAAIELLRAERGFLLIDDGAGALEVATARNLDRDDLVSGPAEYSRSIAERAAHDREVIVSLDAVEDRRFESSRSVAALHVRSVVAVPLESRSRLLGCLYLDHRLRARAFAERDVALIRGLADHAAVAIENARLHDEERKQRQEVGRLNAELADRVSVQAEELTALRREVRQGRAALELRYNYDKLIGRSPAMLELFRLLDRVTDTSLPVVIYGESGTGKELVARAIHHNGARAARPFVSESCAAIPDTLLESILFGHTRGSFTGADSDRRGLFEVASGGTLFLDEVGEMSPSMQAKLLRVLQQGELRRVGSEKIIKVDVRVVVASNRDLQQLVSTGAFREDLFYRLNVVRVALPSLRQRSEDIPLLVDHFLRKIGEQQNQPPRRVARAALDRLITYQWPGNVRELENEMLRAAALGGELISVADLSPHIAAGSLAADVSASATFDLKERVERLEKALVREALDRSGGNQSKAAEMLGLSRFGLTKKLKRYRMST